MNIKLLDSWLREYLKTRASAQKIAELLSLSSVSIENLEKHGDDWIYDVEVTTNRPDLMSVTGLAQEAAAVLTQEGIQAEFIPPKYSKPESPQKKESITIKNDPALVRRICAVIMEVQLKKSPPTIQKRLETSDIRSLNNVIDVTNYVMRQTGHPTHAFDYDRLTTKKLNIREARKGEKVITLDGKEYTLPGEDIVADNGEGEIVDLLGVMGTENSVVTDNTTRILFFIDTVEPIHVRKTSMSTTIRTEAAVLNEKGIDPEKAYQALLAGIALYKEIAEGKIISDVIDIYPGKPKEKTIEVASDKMNEMIGVEIPPKTSVQILKSLGFDATLKSNTISVVVPSWRNNDIEIEEDIVEEIARIYGYHRLPSVLPPVVSYEPFHLAASEFFWEDRVKDALKYWGFTEVYTYSMVSHDLYEGPMENAVTLKNPLNEEMVYMRQTLVPSLLSAANENASQDELKIFEIANVYKKRQKKLPDEILMLAGVVKKPKISFYEVKSVIEQLLRDVGIEKVSFKAISKGGMGADVYIEKEQIGEIEVLDENTIDFELNFEIILQHVSLKKVYKPVSKFPPMIENIRVIIDPAISYAQVVNLIRKQDKLVAEVRLLDVYKNKKTFRIIYQNPEKNLTSEEVAPVRAKIIKSLEKEFNADLA